ncbi:MAG: DUF1501 domain-containing protein [Saprospiraceae bacterium]|nr:DUF1501 domain-containing protein [Saprospiraceae bacterium]
MKIIRELFHRECEHLTRRHFLKQGSLGLGAAALSYLTGCHTSLLEDHSDKSFLGTPKLVPKAKRIIFLHMAGAPSQLDLFDYKPLLHQLDGKPCPESLLKGKRFAFITGIPEMLGPQFRFSQYGASGSWVSELLPHFTEVVDDVLFMKAMHTEEFNHAPAQLFMHTGSPRLGRPSFGSWVNYGLGSENENLPGFVVLVSGNSQPSGGKSLWGSGFLPSVYQGVEFRSKGDPVLYVSNPEGIRRNVRRVVTDAINKINESAYQEVGDPEILTRMAQYEMAFKMQMSVPEATDIGDEPEYIHKMYGTDPGKLSFANNCLLARRLAERNVRFIQLYHRGWDSHGSNDFENLHGGFVQRCAEIDQPMTALVKDLKQRGMLEDTLVVWGGEFGRTPMQENRQGNTNPFKGRDHHGNAFTMWMTGAGVKTGITYGETDEIGYDGINSRIHIHDLQATLLNRLGLDHEKLTYPFQGRDFRLTDVHGRVVNDIIT